MLEAKRNNSGEKAIMMQEREKTPGGSGKEWERPFIGADTSPITSMGVSMLEGGQLGVG